MKKIISLCLVFLLFISFPGESLAKYYNKKKNSLISQEVSSKEKKELVIHQQVSPFKVGLMSLIPGMGQFYNKKRAKGLVMASLYVLSLTTALIFHLKYDDSYKTYQGLPSGTDPETFDKWFNQANDNYKNRNSLFWVALGIIGMSILDAFLDAQNISKLSLGKDEDQEKKSLAKERMMPKKKVVSNYQEQPKEEIGIPSKDILPSPYPDPYHQIWSAYSILEKRQSYKDLDQLAKEAPPIPAKEKTTEEEGYPSYFQKEHFEYASGTVISSLKILTSFPSGLAFDGNSLWYSDFIEKKIYQIDPLTGDQRYSFPAPGEDSAGLSFGEGYLWNSDKKEGKIYKINPRTGMVVSEIPAPNRWISGLAHDGEALWCCDEVVGIIYRIDTKDGVILHQIRAPESETYSIAWDGECLWCLEYKNDFLYKINPEDGSILESYPAPTSLGSGLVFDGFYLWCLDKKCIFKVIP
ncbi:hypothetical protein KKB54_05765 [bacterium]|nr:hypothetical protein [bacterium]MBU1153374.1 hypothetical protein [bacterium]